MLLVCREHDAYFFTFFPIYFFLLPGMLLFFYHIFGHVSVSMFQILYPNDRIFLCFNSDDVISIYLMM